MDQDVLAEIKAFEAAGDYEQPALHGAARSTQHYVKHVLRMPPDEWPDPVQRGFAHINPTIYVSDAGAERAGRRADAKLAHWDRVEDLATIDVPTLVIGAEHDTMDPRHMEAMAAKLPHGEYLYCPHGSHLAMYDDQQVYFDGMIAFVNKLRNSG